MGRLAEVTELSRNSSNQINEDVNTISRMDDLIILLNFLLTFSRNSCAFTVKSKIGNTHTAFIVFTKKVLMPRY